jgi:nicotinate-nucleotide adenylyltransferase
MTPATPDLIVFGGAFDPPHAGHRAVAIAAATRYPAARILVLPSPSPAGASGRHKTPQATFDQRVAMCRLAFAGLPAVEVSTLESELPPPNYTFATIALLRERYPDRRLALLVGEDQLASFGHWRFPGKILASADLVVVPRVGGAGLEASLALFNAQFPGTPVEIAGPAVVPAESRILREMHKTEQALPEGWLTPDVLRYIEQHSLYHLGTPT